VVFHDAGLRRVAGTDRAISDLTWADLRSIRIGGAQTVPRLDDVLAGWPSLRFNIDAKSPAVLAPLARVRALRIVLAQLVRPRVALVLWGIVIGCWHVPRLYDYTLTHRTVHALEHLCFVTAGVLVWTQIVDPARRRELTVPHRFA